MSGFRSAARGVLAVVLWMSCAAGVAHADDAPLLAAIFADHVVLQRDRPIEVWGRAQPGEQVTVNTGAAPRAARAPIRPATGPSRCRR